MDIKEVEKRINEMWKEEDTYRRVKETRKDGKPFYFCDGPPYATGQPHPGTAWNKVMKDAVIRFWRLRGYNVRDQAGFDTHGLPIEVKVEKELGIKSKQEIEDKIGVERFVEECKKFATRYIGIMSEQFRSLGVWMDFDDPYLTYHNSFIEKSWETIKKAHEKGLLTEELYVVPYCPRCETTSANYELEYKDKTDPSIIVKFPVKGEDKKFLIIWTTTPWTLPANVGVMAHPDETYVEAEVGLERWIFAKARLEFLESKIDHDIVVLREFLGRDLKGMEYAHPLEDEVPLHKGIGHRVILSDEFVTMEEGTGLVHTAPGHGPEDFVVGKREGLDILCPVDGRGRFTEEAGKYKGYYVFDANKAIIDDLEEKGLLVFRGEVRHRYAHCWRCKTPLIYLSTKQWFIKVSKIKDEMVKEIDKTYWRPDYAKKQFKAFVEEAPDWCISRQRYWGIPLPIWRCKCGNVRVIGSIKELGVELKDLHRPHIDSVRLKCDRCGSDMERVPDVLDVWFDSGNAVWASLREGEDFDQADVILEGKDQIRGWFYSLLGSGVVNKGKSPYKAVMMHGYFTDEKGEKMSKSLGNYVPLDEILDRTSVDTFRFWGLQNIPWKDIRFNWNELSDVKRFLIITLNLINYMKRFYVKPEGEIELEEEDRWILGRLRKVRDEVTNGFEALEFYRGARALRQFIVEDLSRFYMKLAKKRVSEGRNAEAVHHTLYKVLRTVSILMAPYAPHVAEYMHREFFMRFEDVPSVHMMDWPEVDEEVDENLDREFELIMEIVGGIGAARNQAGIRMRWPLRASAVVVSEPWMEKACLRLSRIIEDLANVKRLQVFTDPSAIDFSRRYDAKIMDGKALVSIDGELDEETRHEGLRNEIVRRIQAMRKEMGLVESDSVDITYECNDDLAKVIEMYIDDISKTVRALSLKRGKPEGFVKEWTIDGNRITIGIKR